MKGSIRLVVGFLLVFGAVGGMETVADALLVQVVTAVIGLGVMYSGVKAMERA